MHICFGKNNLHLPEDGENSLTPTLCGDEKITLNKSVSVSSVPTLTSGGTTKRTPHLCGDDKSPYLPDSGCDCSYFIEKGADEGTFETYNLIMNGQVRGDTIYVPKRLGVTQTDYYLLTNQGDSVEDAKTLVDKTASGDIVTIDDSAGYPLKSLSVSLSPIQNLNGYDHPWVGGSGKNKLKYPYVSQSGTINGITYTHNSDGSVSLSGTATATTDINFNAGSSPYVIGGGTQRVVSSAQASYNPTITGLNFQTDIYKDGTYVGTVQNGNAGLTVSDATEISIGLSRLRIESGAIIPSGTVFYPQIEFGTAPTAYEPYSNICPISGWDGVEVTRAGKNLLPISETAWIDVVYEDGRYSVDVTTGGSATERRLFGNWGIQNAESLGLKSGTYTWAWYAEADGGETAAAIVRVSQHGTEAYQVWNVGTSRTINADDKFFILLYFGAANTHYKCKMGIQIERGTAYTAYEPYADTTYTQEFEDAQGNTLTVYGGEDEIVGGVLTVTQTIVDLGTLQWGKYTQWGSDHTFLASLTFDSTGITTGVPPETFKSDAYKGITQAAALGGTDTGFWVRGDNQTLYFSDARYTDATAYKSAVSGLHLVYPLATPITYTLTPQQVETLIGTNNIWSDTGEVTVEYVGMDEAEWTTENTVPDPYNRFVWWKYTEQYEDGSEQFESEPVVFNSYPGYTKETIGSASEGEPIKADDITSWTTNTPTRVTPKTVVTGGTTQTISIGGGVAGVSGAEAERLTGGVLNITPLTVTGGSSETSTQIDVVTGLQTGDSVTVVEGTAASLNYTEKTIPNISVEDKQVVTDLTE